MLSLFNGAHAVNDDLESGRSEVIRKVRQKVKDGLLHSLSSPNEDAAISDGHQLADKNCWFRIVRIFVEQDKMNWQFRKHAMEHKLYFLKGIAGIKAVGSLLSLFALLNSAH